MHKANAIKKSRILDAILTVTLLFETFTATTHDFLKNKLDNFYVICKSKLKSKSTSSQIREHDQDTSLKAICWEVLDY